jgi:hypothetical protein
MKTIVVSIDELYKARKPGSKDIKPRKKRAQWHEDFKKQHGRYPNPFEVFMRTSGKHMSEEKGRRIPGATVVYDKKLGRKVSIPD